MSYADYFANGHRRWQTSVEKNVSNKNHAVGV